MKRRLKILGVSLSILGLLSAGGYYCLKSYEQNIIDKQVTSSPTSDKNQETFKEEAIRPLTYQELLYYRKQAFDKKVDKYPSGYLSIPSAKIYLPVYPRANNLTLSLGVGRSYFYDNAMGEGNFVVAGHNMLMHGVLLSDLFNAKIGSTMSISGTDNVYTYQIKTKKYVDGSVKLVNGQAQKGSVLYLPSDSEPPLLTVYTCNSSGSKRFMVQGELVQISDNK